MVNDTEVTLKELLAVMEENIIKSIERNAQNVSFKNEKEAINSYNQNQYLIELKDLLGDNVKIPPTRGWAASPDFLLYLFKFIKNNKPTVVVELGCGASTVVIAEALKQNEFGFLYSIDHDHKYSSKTKDIIKLNKLQNYVSLKNVKLRNWKLKGSSELGSSWLWYDIPKDVSNLTEIDLLIVDGPPATTSNFARYPALPHFQSQLRPSGTIVMDDANRKYERRISDCWVKEWGAYETYDNSFEKGISVFNL